MYLLNLSAKGGMWHKVSFQAEYGWFEFRVFLLLDYFFLSLAKSLVYPTIYPYLEREQMD